MRWIVVIEKNEEIENERKQRIRIELNPLVEIIQIYGEAKVKNNEWVVFSQTSNPMKISLETLQIKMGDIVRDVRARLIEYENLDEGFSVLRWVGFE